MLIGGKHTTNHDPRRAATLQESNQNTGAVLIVACKLDTCSEIFG